MRNKMFKCMFKGGYDEGKFCDLWNCLNVCIFVLYVLCVLIDIDVVSRVLFFWKIIIVCGILY